MCRWLGGISAFLLCLGATAGAALADCPVPSVKCLAAEIFSLAKTLPADNGFRQQVAFAERELAPGDIKIALKHVKEDNPDPSPWEDIEWIARAGRFDAAIKRARQRTAPVERLGGLLAVAAQMLDKNETARAQKIVEDVERELPLIARDGDDQYAQSLPRDTGELWARLGQTDRAARLISSSGAGSVDSMLAMADRYPVAADLREQAWREAERINELHEWQLLVEDAISRGDQAEISRAAQRAGKAIDRATDANSPMWAVPLARVFLTAGSPDLAAKLIKPWPQWVNADATGNNVNSLIPVLAGLARDRDVETAARTVSGTFQHCGSLSRAADEYFRLGRDDVAKKFDAEALAVAESAPTGELKQRTERDSALHNLALARAGHGDIEGALTVVDKLSDGVKVREVTSYVIRRAIDSGRGPVAGAAIERLQQIALTVHDVGLLLRAAEGWYAVGREDQARNSLSQAMKMRDEDQVQLDGEQSGLAAELTWRLDGAGKAESMIAIVDRIGVTDPSAIDQLVEIIRPESPTVAMQLAGRQVEVWRRIVELANIAIQIADNAK